MRAAQGASAWLTSVQAPMGILPGCGHLRDRNAVCLSVGSLDWAGIFRRTPALLPAWIPADHDICVPQGPGILKDVGKSHWLCKCPGAGDGLITP